MTKILASILVLLAPMQTLAGDTFRAEFPRELSHVRAALCFDGQPPRHLYRHSNAASFSQGIYHDGNRLKISERGSYVRLPALPDNACINWRVDLKLALKEENYRLILQRGNDLVMSTDLWFWKGSRERDLTVEVRLPEGMAISTPWKDAGNANGIARFRPDKTPAYWQSRIAIGQFKIETINVPGAQVRLAVLGSLSTDQNEKIRTWIEETVNTVTSVNGHFPQPQPQVLIVPTGSRRKPVLMAHVMRGGGLSAEFFIDETRRLKEFIGDWTATHEFSHMLIPYISSRDRWLSEGLASYYQNVLRARNGNLTEREAWQKLYEGFQRGEDGTHGGSLAEATRNGWRSTMRVYWSGAAMMLKADMQLREISGGEQSLDTALMSLSSCCMENGKTWRARDMFKRLDELTGTTIFTGLYQEHVNEDQFPDMRPAWKHLGISTRRDRVRLTEDAPLAAVRISIMKG